MTNGSKHMIPEEEFIAHNAVINSEITSIRNFPGKNLVYSQLQIYVNKVFQIIR